MNVRQPACSLTSFEHRPARSVLRGFTMIELLIVLAIGAILATIAIPSFRDMLRSTRQNSALGLLISDLNQARGEAIKRNAPVLLCASNAAGDQCGAAGDWKIGWLVCSEGAANQCAVSSTDNPNPLVVRPKLDPSLALTVKDGGGTDLAVVRFRANSSQDSGTVTMQLVSGATTRTVSVAPAGNISKS